MRAICFDIEATDGDEILELSVYDVEGRKEIYHSYFKPVRSREWPHSQAVHHISPQMVASAPEFRLERPAIRRLLERADVIVGFAVDNDVKYMEANGVSIPQGVLVVDARIWYGLVYGREQGLEFNAVPRLAACANALGIPFSEEEEAHAAGNDTRVTVELFLRILRDCNGGVLSADLIREMDARFERERDAFMREHAHGYISLVRRDKGYLLKNNHSMPERVDCVIEVEGRFTAEHELRERFAPRRLSGDLPLYALTDRDLRFFRNYANAYDEAREAMCKRLCNAGKSNLRFRM